MKSGVLSLLLAAFVNSSLLAAGPQVSFGRNGVTVGGVKPGTKVAWMAIVRERINYIPRTTVVRGVDVVTPAGKMMIELAGVDVAQTIWSVAELDEGSATRATPDGYEYSNVPVEIVAVAGADHFAVTAADAEIMYVRPGKGVWSFGGTDGSGMDSDRDHDARLTIALSTLTRYQGNPHPPERIEAGDVVLVVDTRLVRTGVLEVKE